MPINRLLPGHFDPEHCQAMVVAFDGVLQELGLQERKDPLCDVIACQIVELGQKGVREPAKLHELVMKNLRG